MEPMVGRLPRARRALLVLLTVVFAVAVLELSSAVVLGVLDRRVPTWSRLQRDRAAIAALDRSEVELESEVEPAVDEVSRWMLKLDEREVIHPYLGFVEHHADDSTLARRTDFDPEAARFGFPRNTARIFFEPDPSRLVVVVVGGSFSRQIGFGGQRLLREGLEKIDRFRGREIEIVALGLGGYKQPQQLMTVSYFLALGMHVDVLINIDGFNEVVLPRTENLKYGVNPFFPRAWNFRVADLNPDELRLRAGIEAARGLRARQASAFSGGPARYSMTCSLIWRVLDRRALGLQITAEEELRRSGVSDSDYQASGPMFEAESDAEMVKRLVEVWRRCSVLLDALARANGIEYYHFLQPNQYLEGSKPLSGRERQIAVVPETGIADPVMSGYPAMRAAASGLSEAGVHFVDLTQVFAEIDESLYIDNCCHINEHGIAIVVEQIVEAVAAGPQADLMSEAN
jgi:hypothetical protein